MTCNEASPQTAESRRGRHDGESSLLVIAQAPGETEAGTNATLTVMSTDELLVEALRLSRSERARVAEELLSSLEEPDDEVAAAWANELERRSRDVTEGRVQTTGWDTVRTEILKELEQRSARRTAS